MVISFLVLHTLRCTVVQWILNELFGISGKFPIITFDEYISIALDAPRVVGIYPEIKNPVFMNQQVSKS